MGADEVFGVVQENAEKVKACFQKFDLDGNGLISKDELFKVFKILDKSFIESDMDLMLNAADTNRDGKIDYEEFISWVFLENVEVDYSLRASEASSKPLAKGKAKAATAK